MLTSGGSYLSSSELVLTFGLGRHAKADAIEIRWPSGQTDQTEKYSRRPNHHSKRRLGHHCLTPLAKR